MRGPTKPRAPRPPPIGPAHRGAGNLVKMVSGRLATQIVLVLSAFAIPRILGVEDFGRYAPVLAVIAIVGALSTLGMPLVEMRFLSPKWQQGLVEEATGLASSIWSFRLFMALLASLLTGVWIHRTAALEVDWALAALIGLSALGRYTLEASRTLFLPLGHPGKTAGYDLLRAVMTLGCVVALFTAWGLGGVFMGLAVAYAALFVVATAQLRGILVLTPRRFRWSALGRYVPFSLIGFMGIVATVVQSQFAVYWVGASVAPRQAAYLSIAVGMFSLLQSGVYSARQALMPVLSELEELGQRERLRHWGGLMMRYGAAAGVVGVVVWAALGRWILARLLPGFEPVYLCGTLMLVAGLFFACAAACTVLLYVKQRPLIASLNLVVYAGLTILGTWIAVRSGGEEVAFRIGLAYALASALHYALGYASLAWLAGIWLPLRRTVLLMLPAAMAWPAAVVPWTFSAQLVLTLGFLAGYGVYAATLGLLPPREISQVLRLLSVSSRPGSA